MNLNLQNPTALVGRILLALIFVLSGFNKISGFDGTAAYSSPGQFWLHTAGQNSLHANNTPLQ